MYALTIHQPWAWAVSRGLKTVENRTWQADRLIGQRFAIHAAAREAHDVDWVGLTDAPPAPADLSYGRVVATAVVDRFVFQGRELSKADRRWFDGPIGWLLRDVRPASSPLIRGQQGLWKVDPKLIING